MTYRRIAGAAALAACLGAAAQAAPHAPTPLAGGNAVAAPAAAPRIDAVFVLDTTGSMSGLIEGAKRKIWSIANEMASAQPTPEIRIGLLGYRDRGDAYVTQRFDLTHDLDAMFGHLTAFQADGGGDGPESVNQALHEAVTRMSWSGADDVYQVVFLVGDAPPHLDYQDDVPYRESVAEALERGIVINTIQCGEWHETAQIWREIARGGEGAFAAIAQDGAMAAVETPHDAELAALSAELAETVVPFGGREEREVVEQKLRRAAEAPAPAAAERLAYLGKSGEGPVSGAEDLVDAFRSGAVAIADMDDEALPESLREMDAPAREAYLNEQARRRDAIQASISELVQKRDAHVAAELERREAAGEADGFDRKVSEMIRSQAARAGIRYE